MPIKVPRLTEYNFLLSVSPYETVVVEDNDTGEVEIDDSYFDRVTAATVDVTGQVQVTGEVGNVEIPTFISLDENIAVVDSDGRVTRVTDGEATILVRTPILGRKVMVDCERVVGATVDTLTGFVPGTFAAACAEASALLVPGKSTQAYIVANFAGKSYTRNPDFWGHGLDLTCIPAGHSFKGTSEKGGILITPKHLACAYHYWLSVGDKTHFVTMDNECIERTVVARTRVGASTDTAIIEYDEALPESITPCKLLPANWRDYVGNPYGDSGDAYDWVIYWTSHIPMFVQNKAREMYARHLNSTVIHPAYEVITDLWLDDNDSNVAFTYKAVSGDSGSAVFFLLNSLPVYAFSYHTGTSGTDNAKYLSEINAICSPLAVTTVDLSGFDTFTD